MDLIPFMFRKRSSEELSESSASTLSPDPDNLLGRRIQHTWREKGNVTKWKGTVLERLTVNSSLYMVKYDGFDCVYGIELFKDSRVSNLQVLSEKVGECDNISLQICFAWCARLFIVLTTLVTLHHLFIAVCFVAPQGSFCRQTVLLCPLFKDFLFKA